VTRGVGVDVVDVARFAASLERTPALRLRLFTPTEAARSEESLAARFAAKEALAKALGAPGNLEWLDAEVVALPTGQPTFVLRGTVAARAEELGVTATHLSLSHDGGVAIAFVTLD
jgi:holo-[acyl-carrier protein] synthase